MQWPFGLSRLRSCGRPRTSASAGMANASVTAADSQSIIILSLPSISSSLSLRSSPRVTLLARPVPSQPLEVVVLRAVAVMARDAGHLAPRLERHPWRYLRVGPVVELPVLQPEVYRVPCPGVARAAAGQPGLACGAEHAEP